ncbi:hypothetical protein AAFP35_19190 [Gordonia sp. CPCC 206044]|uniref:hypothetical protein n=1 Tax=Gordonia sp. CPCC 206044 TaxID=3140793 RepID=UPI003AF347E8
MAFSRVTTWLVRAVITVLAVLLVGALPLADSLAASTKGMGGGHSSGTTGPNKATPGNRGGGQINKMKPRPAQPAPGRNSGPSSTPGNTSPGGTRPAPSRPRSSAPKPDRGPHKFSPNTKAPNGTKRGSSGDDRDDKTRNTAPSRPTGPAQNRGPNKFSPNTKAPQTRNNDSRGRGHSRPGDNDRMQPQGPVRPPRDTAPAVPLNNGPEINGGDEDQDGIVDNEGHSCDVACPWHLGPSLRGGGFPFPMRPPMPAPKAPAPKAPEPAPKAPEPAPKAPEPAPKAPEAGPTAPQPAPKAPEAAKAPRPSKRTPQEAEDIIRDAQRSGSGLKKDTNHRAPDLVVDEIGTKGKVFDITGNDGVERTLVQTPGELNGVPGRFEWIIEPNGRVSHQFFVRGGSINGIPNKP